MPFDITGAWVPELDPRVMGMAGSATDVEGLNPTLPGNEPTARPVVVSATDQAATEAKQFNDKLAAEKAAQAVGAIPAAVPAATPPAGAAVTPQQALATAQGSAPSVSVTIPGSNANEIKAATAATAAELEQRGQVELEAGQLEAEARKHLAETEQLQAEKHAALAQQRDNDVRRIQEEQQRAYDEAHNTVLPDFWAGSFGRIAQGAISQALGEAGRGLQAFGSGVNVGNSAKDIIDRAVTMYQQDRKEQIDRLFKYAQAKNMLGEQQKLLWQDKLKDLQWEMAAIHQSAAEHIMEVAAMSKGRINQEAAKVLAKEQAVTGLKLEQDANTNAAKLQMEKRRLGLEAYQAETARINALTQKENQLTLRDENLTRQLGNDLERKIKADQGGQTAKTLSAIVELQGVIEELDSGNPLRYGAALDKFTKSATGLGARPGSVKLFEERLGSDWEHIKAMIGKAVAGEPMTDEQLSRFKSAAKGELETALREKGHARKRIKEGLDKDKLYSSRPDMVSRVLDSTFGPEEAQHSAVPAGPPAGYQPTNRVTKAGKPVFKGPNGELWAE